MTEYVRIPDDWEGNFEALLTPHSWRQEAVRLNNAGITRAGQIGAVCPDCWREIPKAKGALLKECACPGVLAPDDEVLAALGFTEMKMHLVNTHGAPL